MDDKINSVPETANTDAETCQDAPITEKEKNIESAETAKKPKFKYKKLLMTMLFIVVNAAAIGIVLYMELADGDRSFAGAGAAGAMIRSNFYLILIALFLYLIHVLCDAVAYFVLIKQCGYGNRFALCMRLAVYGKYYDSITPWNSGGPAFKMAYLKSSSIDTATACSVPIVKYTIRIFTANIFILILFLTVPLNLSTVIKVGAYIGLITTPALPLFLVIFSKRVDILLKITKKLVGFLHKIKIVKDYDKWLKKAQELTDNFMAAFKYLSKHKHTIIIIGIVTIIDYLVVAAVPFVVIKMFGGAEKNILKSIVETFYVTLSSGVVPTPGAAGAAEGSFYSVFAASVPVGYLFWAVLFWRIMVFYMPIILGVIMHFVDWIKGKTKISLVAKDIAWRFKKTLGAEKKNSEE